VPGWRPLARAIDWPADCYPGLLRHWLLAGCMTGRVVCGSALHTHTHTPFIGSVLHAIHIPRILSVLLALQVSLREQCHNELCPWSCKSLTQLYANKRSMKREAGGRVSLDIRLATSPPVPGMSPICSKLSCMPAQPAPGRQMSRISRCSQHDNNNSSFRLWKICVKFGHLILRKVINFVSTICQISRLKCTKIDFRWAPSTSWI